MRYTIESAQPTGKSDPTYGQEYLVTFNEDGREVKMNRKYPPKVGSELIGDIIQASWGAYFKKDPNAQNTNTQTRPASDMPRKNEHTMYVSYAKDLLISYMNANSWDFNKVSEEGIDIVARLIAETAKTLESAD